MPPKSQASARTVPLDWTTLAMLTVHQRQQQEQAPVWHPGVFVFARADGTPFDPSWLTASGAGER